MLKDIQKLRVNPEAYPGRFEMFLSAFSEVWDLRKHNFFEDVAAYPQYAVPFFSILTAREVSVLQRHK